MTPSTRKDGHDTVLAPATHDHHAPASGPASDLRQEAPARGEGRSHSHHGHGLMMLVCCIPMLIIAGVLVLAGIAGPQVILIALVCTAMMAAMMLAMPGGHH